MKRNEIKAGALLSYLNLLIGNLIPFIYTPIMLRMLGQAEYGIYGIAQSVLLSAIFPSIVQKEIWRANGVFSVFLSRYTL